MSKLHSRLFAVCLALVGLPVAYADEGADPALAAVIAARSEEDRARDIYRHPAETLAFFQVKPGMTVAEGLPGGGWYTRILANYLGADGTLYGVNYPDRLWPLLRPSSPDWVAERIAATDSFTADVASFTDNGIAARGFTFETVPPELNGTVDRVLLIRALHNLNRFEQEAGTRSRALAAVHAMLKDDGLVGVVQHRAPATSTVTWANGDAGYLTQTAVIVMFEEAGFELVDESEINANPLDRPTGDDVVWRLPPSLRGSEEDPELRAAMLAIGESDRMTLVFRKAR